MGYSKEEVPWAKAKCFRAEIMGKRLENTVAQISEGELGNQIVRVKIPVTSWTSYVKVSPSVKGHDESTNWQSFLRIDMTVHKKFLLKKDLYLVDILRKLIFFIVDIITNVPHFPLLCPLPGLHHIVACAHGLRIWSLSVCSWCPCL